jgi:Carbamoyl-phosphate synthase L chain, ATP binding domain
VEKTGETVRTSRSRPQRLAFGNDLEWDIQPGRSSSPGNKPVAGSGAFGPGDMTLFWSGDNKIVVTQQAMGTQFLDDCRAILGYENLTHLAAGAVEPSHSLSEDVMGDDRVLTRLAELLDGGPDDGPVYVESYAATPEYAALVANIRARLSRPVTDLMTPEDLELISILDSKIQAREFFSAAAGSSSIRLTRAFTARRGSDLARLAESVLRVIGPVIVKADFGAGGHDMTLVKSPASLRDDIAGLLSSALDSDFLIEEYLKSPSGDVLPVAYSGAVGHDGEVSTIGTCRQFFFAEWRHVGSHVGIGAMPPGCSDKVFQAGEAIAKIAGSFGYRGPLNIDFLYRDSDFMLFPLEMNPRRCLSATLGDICMQIFGLGYEKTVSAMAKRWVPVHPSIASYGRLRDTLLSRGLFARETEGLVILPYMVTTLPESSIIGLAVLGTDPTTVDSAFSEVTHLLAQPPGA